MSVGLLIITHSDVGQSLYDTAVAVIGATPLTTKIMSASMDCDPEQAIDQARRYLHKLNEGDGVLVITDMYGATPSNIASALLDKDIALVSGINLPMLVRVMNYPNLTLDELTEKAISGGRDGILAVSSNNN